MEAIHRNEGGRARTEILVAGALIVIAFSYWLWHVGKPVRNDGHLEQPGQGAQVSAGGQTGHDTESPVHEQQKTNNETKDLPAPSAEAAAQVSQRLPALGEVPTSITRKYTAFAPKVTESDAAQRGSRDGEQYLEGDRSLRPSSDTVEVQTDSHDCKYCWTTRKKGIQIPRSCTYVSHTITQLHREPYAPIEQLDATNTKYSDDLHTDESGRLLAIWLSATTYESGSGAHPSITMQLTVYGLCPPGADIRRLF